MLNSIRRSRVAGPRLRMRVDLNKLRLQIEKEIRDKIPDDKDTKRQAQEFALRVALTARQIATQELDHGYATGEFVKSIQVRRMKRWWRKTMPNYEVYSEDPKANLLEYGTKADTGGHANWIDLDGERRFGPNTPTPEFLIFAQTAWRYGGTPDD